MNKKKLIYYSPFMVSVRACVTSIFLHYTYIYFHVDISYGAFEAMGHFTPQKYLKLIKIPPSISSMIFGRFINEIVLGKIPTFFVGLYASLFLGNCCSKVQISLLMGIVFEFSKLNLNDINHLLLVKLIRLSWRVVFNGVKPYVCTSH